MGSDRQLRLIHILVRSEFFVHGCRKERTSMQRRKKICGEHKEEKSTVLSFQRQTTTGRIPKLRISWEERYFFHGNSVCQITIVDRLLVFVDVDVLCFSNSVIFLSHVSTHLTQFQNWRTNPGRLAQKWNLVISNLLCDGWCVDDKQVHFAV